MNISELTKAIVAARLKSLADKAYAPIDLEPKSLRDLMVPEVLVTEDEATVVYTNEHGVRVRACTIGPNPPSSGSPESHAEYMAHHLDRSCKQVLLRFVHRALRQGMEGLVVDTPFGQVAVRGEMATLLDAEWEIRLTLTAKKPISFE